MRRLLLLLPLVTVSLLAVLYLAVDYWLESAGGRRALEKTLGSRIGMPVHLNGEFNIKLLPSVGVSGTRLIVTDPATNKDLAAGGYFEVDLELAPLLRQELEVRHLLVEDLKLNLPDGRGFFIPMIRLESFGFNQPTGFEIDWSFMGTLNGQFTWFPEESRVLLDVLWKADERDDLTYRGSIAYGPGQLDFASSEVTVGAQSVTGEGCLLLTGQPELNLVMEAETLDLEALWKNVPGGQGSAEALPVQMNLRLDAIEIRRGDMVARDTRLEIGAEPACP